MVGCPPGLVSLMVDPEVEVAWVLILQRASLRRRRTRGALFSAGTCPRRRLAWWWCRSRLGDLGGKRRSCARAHTVGDVVAVCGSLGWSGAGLATYAAGWPNLPPPTSPVADRDLSLLRWFHCAAAAHEAGPVAAAAGASAMLDISDGLVRATVGGSPPRAGVSLELSREAPAGQFVGPVAAVLGEAQAWGTGARWGEEHLARDLRGRIGAR